MPEEKFSLGGKLMRYCAHEKGREEGGGISRKMQAGIPLPGEMARTGSNRRFVNIAIRQY
jgi:hypothetical protein